MAILIDTGANFGQEGRAAELAAAGADAADHLGLVAHADLAQLDAGVELGGEIADQLAEVDARLRGEVEERPSAALGARRGTS